MSEVKTVALPSTKTIRQNAFYKNYIVACQKANMPPLNNIKKGNTKSLSVVADRVDIRHWAAIINSLSVDQTLHSISIILRRRSANVMQNIDSFKKLHKVNPEIPILSKILFDRLIGNISRLLSLNMDINTLALEGLPILPKYTYLLLKGISKNTSICHLSFERSNLSDEGVEAICNTMKYSLNVETLNFSDCNLSQKCGKFISDLIKTQSISRYSEGWKRSLRYQEIDPNNICGLRHIKINKNLRFGDDGLESIIEVLKDDEWIKTLEARDCGLTDASADLIIDSMQTQKLSAFFDLKYNKCISKERTDRIKELLGCEIEHDTNNDGKHVVKYLKEQLACVQDQLSTETLIRKRCEELNAQLQTQLADCQKQLDKGKLSSSESLNFKIIYYPVYVSE